MRIRGTTRLLGILGNPVSHSHSPAMHNAAIEKLGLDLAYVPLPVDASELPGCLRALQAFGFLGVNVTMPHKQAVLPLLDEISDLSRLMGAVNTVAFRDGKSFGTTTDPAGFLAGFQEAGHSFAGKSVALFGNGGAARTAAFTLLHEAAPGRVAVIGRDAAKSEALRAEVESKLGQELEILPLQEYADRKSGFEVVVHATSVGMHPRTEQSLLPPDWLDPGQIVYDIVYNPEDTALLRHARARGCRVVGGLGMLVHQGLASFRIWTGISPDPAIFFEGIRRTQAKP
jgi:shikimate dehydrogenase